jgi:transcriptional regulator with XRE-family HTH domain
VTDTEPKETITGSQIRRARAMLNWRPSELALKAKVSRATIERAEKVNGAPEIDPAYAAALRAASRRFGVDEWRHAGRESAGDEHRSHAGPEPSEWLSFRHVAQGELAASEMDWVALQRLRTMALAEESLGGGWKLTKVGRRARQPSP